ncbi:hypothetical protein AAMO2058_001329800, partial [Amorphochlora amoebiformis]|uniref:Uncharacterized protein n=1 Tax=Amorphochlora amoebiformis TaxID=1561963 RepID=A0A7S0D265_9EUKA|mmetsp:Transcript_1675/g.2372  ORF Transcript_1675/g.2372 Transcript_1675/m.2372 type:complete len:203 (+) Transcript_1675:125-733(+)
MSEMKQRKKIVENEDSKPTVMPSNTDKDSTGKDKDLFATYNSLMVSYPFTVNAVQAGVINILGSLTHAFVLSNEGLNAYDTVKYMFLAMFVITPMALIWYGKVGGMGYTQAVQLALEWVVFTPIVNFCFMTANTMIDQKGSLPEYLSEDFYGPLLKIVMGSYIFWIPFGAMRNSLCPPNMFILANCVGSYFWQIILVSTGIL